MGASLISRTFWLLAGLFLAVPTAVDAGTLRVSPVVVLELFTSQGCPNSPLADSLLTELAQDPSVIALAYHVDYWDYVGWEDTFGDAANSDRQRGYSAQWGNGRLFTPQIVVNGVTGVVGSDRVGIASAMSQSSLTLKVDLAVADGMLAIDIDAQKEAANSIVWLITYLDRTKVEVEGGENKGQTLPYSHVVTSRQALAVWEPGTGAHLKLPLSVVLTGPSNGAVIIVQEDRNGLPGPIIGAASFQQ